MSLGPPPDRALDSALGAMTAEELRAFVRDVLEDLDDKPYRALADALISRAAKGRGGWRPPGPSPGLAGEVGRFADAARDAGYASPDEVDDYLRQGSQAFLAGDHAAARAVFETLLPPIGDGEIDLGQHEMVDEVLTVDEYACAAQYVTSVYLTTPLKKRAEAVWGALHAVQGVAPVGAPLEQMERVATDLLPDFDAFLARWVKLLEGQPPSKDDWEGDRDRWLREAVMRLEGIAGLERIARTTRKPEALRAWCDALVAAGNWTAALQAYDVAAEHAGASHWQGHFLDGAALAARELARPDAGTRLEAAWRGAPSLVRLQRWLGAGNPAGMPLDQRARAAVGRCPRTAGRQLGLLHLLTGKVGAAARLLAKAPGLGWSSEEHPGHVLFPAFAGLLAPGAAAKLSAEIFRSLAEQSRDASELDWDDGDEGRPKLTTPTIAALIEAAGVAAHVGAKDRAAMIEAMRAVATRRVEGILGNKRRRHYGHAAVLVACCLELAPVSPKPEGLAKWAGELCKKYARFSAFQAEYRRALALIAS